MSIKAKLIAAGGAVVSARALRPRLRGLTAESIFIGRSLRHSLRDGESVFGREFPVRMNSMFANSRGAAYRIIPTIVLRPSKDLGKLAADHVRSGGLQSDRRMTSRVIRTIARLESKDEADLTSYVLFDGAYCSKLIELGIHDAQRRRDDLLRFFAEAQQPTQGPAPVEP